MTAFLACRCEHGYKGAWRTDDHFLGPSTMALTAHQTRIMRTRQAHSGRPGLDAALVSEGVVVSEREAQVLALALLYSSISMHACMLVLAALQLTMSEMIS